MEVPKHNFLDTCLFFSTNAFSRQLLKLAEAEFKHLKLSPAHASLLLLVFETPGIGPKELSRLLYLTPSTITRFIDSLVKKKLVARKSKGKSVLIFPTQKSLSMKAEIAMAYKRLYLRYSQILGATSAMDLSHRISKANQRIMENVTPGMTMKRCFKLIVEYDGTLFFGWQRQTKETTIQGELESALSHILNQPISLRGSGRTDAGVHALGQVAHFHAQTQMDPLALKKGLNSFIKSAIVIRECSVVADTFHAQYQARSKEYNYYILNRPDPCAIGGAYLWHLKQPLNLALMNQCCDLITGIHDFKSFENTGSPRSSSIREVFLARVESLDTGSPFEKDLVVFKISASGFLKNMVRNIMGTLVDVGIEKIDPKRFETIFMAKDRSLAGKTAPARGLFLKQVNYS